MTVPKNRMAYKDIYEIFDAALGDEKGIRIPFDTHLDAKYYQMRLHQARKLDRDENAKVYPKGEPMHGESLYDTLQVRIRHGDDGTHFVYIEPRAKLVPLNAIESLTEIEADET